MRLNATVFRFPVICLLALQVGCRGTSDEVSAPADGGDGDGDGDTANPDDKTGATPFALDDADLLFNPDTVPVFSVTLPESEWEDLRANALLEEYVNAELSYEGQDIGTVGIRYKGSYGSLSGCLDDQGELSGCNKLSMKMKFSEVDPDMRFYGLKRLNFHAMARDASKLHDKISYKVYRDAGIIAPRSTWARLEVNGNSLGLFALVEQIDGRFTDNRWPEDGDGNLYKEAWPLSDDADTYTEKLTTNEETQDHRSILDFRDAMFSSAPADGLTTLGEWMDLDQLYTYMAVSDTIGHWDGVTAWYCSMWGCAPHNFYLYQYEQQDTFTLIPWDLDSTLSASTPFDHVPHWTNPGDCDVRYPMFGGIVETQSAGCNNIFMALASKRGRYEAALQTVLDGPFDIARLRNDIDDYVAFIRDEVAVDPTLNGVDPWMLEVERLKDELELLQLRAEAYRDDREVARLALEPGQTLDFEGASALEFVLGLSFWASPGTTASAALNDAAPINGTQDARLDFVYRDNGTEPWAQWIGWTIGMAGGNQDLSTYTGLRISIRTDSPRAIRVDLNSPYQPNQDSGTRFGWDIQSTSTVATFDLAFSDAAIPTWAPSAGEQLAEVLTAVTSLLVNPGAIRQANGFLGEGVEDPGFFQIDDIELY